MFCISRFCFGLMLFILLSVPVEGQRQSFVTLFDGSTLKGWHYGTGKTAQHFTGTSTPDQRFYVKGGAIVLADKDNKGKRGTQTLWCDRLFEKDFILKFEFRATQEATATFLVLNRSFDVADFVRRKDRYRGNLKKFKNDGWNEIVVTVKNTAIVHNRRLGSSDRLKVVYRDGNVTAELNGKTIDPNQIAIHVEASITCNGESLFPHRFAVGRSGRIGIQSGSGKIEFRNLRFQEW
ncbi:MAG: hypothetical protein KatS3mg105_2249 [Gemmatales bacterium]|nr:MAG: hypothetical protein KatS3mg105_2249 [Gemmatales bacterium]